MRRHLGKFFGIAILLMIGVGVLGVYLVGAQNQDKGVEVRVLFKNNLTHTTGTQTLNVYLELTNKNNYPVSFDRVIVGHVNQDLTVRGPVQAWTGSFTVSANSTATFPSTSGSFPYSLSTSTTTMASGTVIPIAVGLFYQSYNAKSQNAKGAGLGGAVFP
jgi:hypothetical protein